MNVILGFGAVLIAMVIVSIILEAAYQKAKGEVA